MASIFKRFEKLYKVTIILVDLALLNFAYIIAFAAKFGWNFQLEHNFRSYLDTVPFVTVAALVYLDVFGLLKFYRKNLYETIGPILSVVGLLGVTTVTITYFNQGFAFPRSILVSAPILQFLMLIVWHWIIQYYKKYITESAKLIVIGNRNEVYNIVDKVNLKSDLNIRYIHIIEENNNLNKKLKDVDEVLLCPGIEDELKLRIISYCLTNKKVVYVIPELFEISLMKSKMVQFEDVPAFMIDGLELSTEQKFFKRALDIVLSFIGIILLLPILVVVVPLILLTSPGKVIYSQIRVTKDNKQFKIYKFRTMYTDAEKDTGPVISSEDDPRITAVGKVLRKLRLDELPQLFNVFMGDMSLIGPRPERPFFVEQFSKDIPEYNYRNVVKAGMTGYAQLLGKYDTTPEDKLRYDLMYIKNYSLLLDIKLLFQTIKVIFVGKNMFKKTTSRSLGDKGKVINL